MKTGNRLRKHVILLTTITALGMYVWTRLDGLLVLGLAACVLSMLWLWSRWHARKAAYIDAITSFVLGLYTPEYRSHAERVAELAEKLAEEMGLPKRKVVLIRAAGIMHDIGRYIKGEYIDDRMHVVKGADLVSHLSVLYETADWIRHHHTWHNGVSSFISLAMTKVPIEAAILAVAEHFDEITHDESDLMTVDDAVEYIRQRIGTQFHPAVVKALLITALQTRQIQQPGDSSNLCPAH